MDKSVPLLVVTSSESALGTLSTVRLWILQDSVEGSAEILEWPETASLGAEGVKICAHCKSTPFSPLASPLLPLLPTPYLHK